MNTSTPTLATYTVSGMTCDHCVRAVTAEVGDIPGVTHVDVDLASGAVTVASEAPVAEAAVAAAVAEAGYELVTAAGAVGESCCGSCH
jgi:copper ion binding protein